MEGEGEGGMEEGRGGIGWREGERKGGTEVEREHMYTHLSHMSVILVTCQSNSGHMTVT